MSKSEEKTFDLNNLGGIKDNDGLLREDKIDLIVSKIQERGNEIRLYKENVKNKISTSRTADEDCFDALRGHDTILIDGRRGSGKTTLLSQIKKREDEMNAYVFRTIDPTLINIQNNGEKTNSDILLMLLSQLYTKVIREIKISKNNEFQHILKEIKEVNDNIIKGYYVDSSMDYNERLYSFNKGLKLDFALHELFNNVCKTLKVEVLVFVIDDIDMELSIAFNIIDVIRRYLGSPRVIPIVAMNSAQAYALIKQHFFKKFHIKEDTPIYNISENTDLDFLKSLPRAYMLKSFLPSRRIVTDDMYAIYKHYNFNGASQLRFTYRNKNGVDFNLDSKVLLTCFVNIVYGAYRNYGEHESSSNNYFIDYLENLSMRSFISDMRNLLETFSKTDKLDMHLITKKDMKDNLIKRFVDFPRVHNRKDIILSNIWEQFIENYSHHRKSNTHGGMLKRTFEIDGHNTYDRYAKTYQRLWMQTYFIDSIGVKIISDKNKTPIIKKLVDINGIFELALRTFIPMHIVDRHMLKQKDKKKNYRLSSSKILHLTSLSTDNLYDLSRNLISLEHKLSKNKKYFGGVNGIDIDEEGTQEIKNVHELITHNWIKREGTNIDNSSMSFLKSLVFLMEYSRFFTKDDIEKLHSNKKTPIDIDNKKDKFISNYLPVGYDASRIDLKKDQNIQNLKLYHTKLINPKLIITNTSFGVLSINRFSKRLVRNFSYIHKGIHGIDKQQVDDSKKKRYMKEKSVDKNYAFSMYISAFLNALLVEYVESLKLNIPIQKGYIYVADNFIRNVDKEWSYKSIKNIDKNNLLFFNLAILEEYFNDLPKINKNYKDIQETLYSIIIFIVRILKYYTVWNYSLKKTYSYSDIYIAKKLSKEKTPEEITIFFVNSRIRKNGKEIVETDVNKLDINIKIKKMLNNLKNVETNCKKNEYYTYYIHINKDKKSIKKDISNFCQQQKMNDKFYKKIFKSKTFDKSLKKISIYDYLNSKDK